MSGSILVVSISGRKLRKYSPLLLSSFSFDRLRTICLLCQLYRKRGLRRVLPRSSLSAACHSSMENKTERKMKENVRGRAYFRPWEGKKQKKKKKRTNAFCSDNKDYATRKKVTSSKIGRNNDAVSSRDPKARLGCLNRHSFRS